MTEQQLAALANASHRIRGLAETVQEGQVAVSYDILPGWDEAGRKLSEAFNQLYDFIAYFSKVETRTASGLAVSTVVHWSGDTDTYYCARSSAAIRSHTAALHLRMRFRRELLEALMAGLQAAAAIHFAMANPLGVLTAVRSTWLLVSELNDVLELCRQ